MLLAMKSQKYTMNFLTGQDIMLNLKMELFVKKVPYVWITTYQNETYRFHDERNVGLEDLRTKIDSYNVRKIIKELDAYLN